MKQQLVLVAITLVYWLVVALVLVTVVNMWRWLPNSPWLFVIFVPFLVVGFLLRSILRRKLLAKNRAQP